MPVNPLLPDLSIRDAHALLALAQEQHFGRAAERCHVTQPTLSAQIQKVERLLGVALFERGGRRFLITPAGARLLPLAQALVDAADALASAADDLDLTPLSGEFRLGAITTLGPYYIPRFLPQLMKAYPRLELGLTERQTHELLKSLAEGALDAALLSGPIESAGIQFMPLFHEPFVLVAPAGHAIATLDPLKIASLKAPEMVLLDEGHCLRDQALDFCNKRFGETPNVVATSVDTLRYLVALGKGYTLLPQLALRSDPALDPLLAFRRFKDKAPSRVVGLAYRSTTPMLGSIHALAELLLRFLPKELQPCR